MEYLGGGKNSTGNCGIWDSCLFRKEGGKYYQTISTDLFPFPFDKKSYYEFVFMEDNAPVGIVWNNNIASGTFTFSNGKAIMEESYIGKIEEYLPFLEVSGRSTGTHKYSDVIKVNMKIISVMYDSSNKIILRTEELYDKWYARGIRLVKATQSTAPFNMTITDFKIF